MIPSASKVTLGNNEQRIKELLDDLVVRPRIQLLKWSAFTKQTPNMKIGYPGQHLASLITGVEGTRTGARGHDLVDGTEVKSCSRVDQLDKCRECKIPVSRFENQCSKCNSRNIKRNNDSKWLFGIRSENELRQLVNTYDRVLLILSDYPNFDDGDYSKIRFQAFEIWPKEPRFACFRELMTSYYYGIHKEGKGSKAPKNFWPESFQFYKCKPVKVFECEVVDANASPSIEVNFLLDPTADRSGEPVMPMPSKLLNNRDLEIIKSLKDDELKKLLTHPGKINEFRSERSLKGQQSALTGLPEDIIDLLPLRDTNNPMPHSSAYSRGDIN